ncbi:MAG: serine/threonine protein kinase [Deltaproteobacteria bacterium]|nr:serine/threonine protein kinase [Deltaproteobacteria bacterium]
MPPEQFGKYTLLSRLGYGGMAEVFLARTTSVGGFEKQVAIKRLLPFCTQDKQTVDLLADEAKITVRLTHPNIVQVFDFGRVADSYYIAMEYVDGLDLKSIVELDEHSSQSLPVELAAHVVISILDALDFAHHRTDDGGRPMGIIHRDVTPHNVLISRHGHIKLTDFGVARAAISSHVSVVGDIRGKFSYMPPEQACGGEIDHRVDIFAAGAILYELLSGKQPFRSTSSGQQMVALHHQVEPPSRVNPTLPPELDEVTLRALERDPRRRYASAKAFASALRRHLEERGAYDPLRTTQTLAERVQRRAEALLAARKNGPAERSISLSAPLFADASVSFGGASATAASGVVHTGEITMVARDSFPEGLLDEGPTRANSSPRVAARGEERELAHRGLEASSPELTDVGPDLSAALAPTDPSAASLSARERRERLFEDETRVIRSQKPRGRAQAVEDPEDPADPAEERPEAAPSPAEPARPRPRPARAESPAAPAPPRPEADDTEESPAGRPEEAALDEPFELPRRRRARATPRVSLPRRARAVLGDRQALQRLLPLFALSFAALGGILVAIWVARSNDPVGRGAALLSDGGRQPGTPPETLPSGGRRFADAAAAWAPPDASPSAPADAATAVPSPDGSLESTPRPTAPGRRIGYLTVNATPRARVYLDGRSTGRLTPLVGYALPPGAHRIRVYYLSARRYSKPRWLTVRPSELTTMVFRDRSARP